MKILIIKDRYEPQLYKQNFSSKSQEKNWTNTLKGRNYSTNCNFDSEPMIQQRSKTDALLYATVKKKRCTWHPKHSRCFSEVIKSMHFDVSWNRSEKFASSMKRLSKWWKGFWLKDTNWLYCSHVAQIGFIVPRFSTNDSSCLSTSMLRTCNNLSWKSII